MISRLSTWLQAFRLRTLPLAFGCVFLGTFQPDHLDLISFDVFVLALLTTLCLQILSNLANDYGDYKKGTDNVDRVGPKRSLQSGAIGVKAMRNMLLAFVFLSFVSGISLIYFALGFKSGIVPLFFVVLGLLSIWAAIKYTVGKKAYGYFGFGEVFVILFFGLAGVGGNYYLQTNTVNLGIVSLGISYGLLAAAVLNINNIRDIENDRNHNKNTLAVFLGAEKAATMQLLFIAGAFLFQAFYLSFLGSFPQNLLILVGFVPIAFNTLNVWNYKNLPDKLNPLLKGLSVSIFFNVVFMLVMLILLRTSVA